MWDGLEATTSLAMHSPRVQASPVSPSHSNQKSATPRAAASSRGYSVASIWEHAAPLTDLQHQSIESLAGVCNHRPIPEHVQQQHEAQPAEPATPTATAQIDNSHSGELVFAGTSFEDVVLQNSAEFYKWLSELESARAMETEGQFRRHAATLDSHLATCDALLASVEEITTLFTKLKTGHDTVSGRTAALHATCERLVSERNKLEKAALAMSETLDHFDELEKLAGKLHSASVVSSDFIPLLQRVDSCMSFIAAHPHYADAATYSIKFRQLQTRAMAAVRAKVNEVLKAAAAAAQQAARTEQAAQQEANTADGAEATLLYVRYRAAAEPTLKSLLQGVSERAQTSTEYSRLLQDCIAVYCDSRLTLLKGPVATRIKSYTSATALSQLLRSGAVYLIQVVQLESQLYCQLFSTDTVPQGVLSPLVDALCVLLYDALRPALISIKDVDALCELADILRVEVLEESTTSAGSSQARRDTLVLLEPVMLRMLADVQERIAFRAQAYIRDEVARFVPSSTDLDYPAKLENLSSTSQIPTPAINSEAESLVDNETMNAEYGGWYAPLQRALLLLSKLYRTVPPKIFSGLAHEAVAAATTAIQDASTKITAAKGPLHGQLFTIKQLLVLREQIAPFQADFAVVERLLDFTHMRDYFKRTLSGQLPLFSLSSDNAVLQFMSKGGPRLQDSEMDSKKELERLLKSSCEAFIMHVTKLVVEPMLSFITKATAARVTSQDKPLREQAFAAADRLKEVVAQVNEAIKEQLPEAINALKLYLPNAGTQGIILKPIKTNIAEAHMQIAALLESDYSPEEAVQVGLLTQDKLTTVLDSC